MSVDYYVIRANARSQQRGGFKGEGYTGYFCMDNLTLLPDPLDPRRQAMYWYWQGHNVAGIAQRLGIKSATLHSWKRRDKWDQYGALEKMQLTTAARYVLRAPVMAMSPGRLCTRCLMSHWRGSPPITAVLWRYFNASCFMSPLQ